MSSIMCGKPSNDEERDSGISLLLFSSCKNTFEPNTDWLDGLSPAHPLFDDAARIEEIVQSLKEELLDAILSGCTILLQRTPGHISFPILEESLKTYRSLWKAIISVQKYGVIYFSSRADARIFRPLYLAETSLSSHIDRFLRENHNFHRTVNYAVHYFINKVTNKVIYPPKVVPPNAISSVGFRHFAVRKKDFTLTCSEALLDDTSVMWDLHDFAHQTAASLSPELYGSKYFSHLQFLPPRATAVIRSPGLHSADNGLKISDGLVFSELLTGLYTIEVEKVLEGSTQHTYASLELTLATAVAEYLLGERSLLHPSTGKMLQLESKISLPQLAVLVQNKAYELTASEIEQRVFTRGGPEGDARDLLDKMDTAQRLETLASSREWMYFEVRNTVKHRAHKTAYRQVAETYRRQPRWQSHDDAQLLSAILSALDYEDWKGDGPPNLWALVAELRCFEPPETTLSSVASISS
ncbi:MAG: hypothetical protein Q9191_000613 [Dirinaria sp. TL-2023a]